MRFTILGFVSAALALPAALQSRADEPVYWLLAGDSTTATNGGWGDAFLATTVAEGSSGKNYGHSGATTKSFRAGGDWDQVIGDVGTHKDDYRVYVTIQKQTSGVTLADYKTNLAKFAAEASAAGATPILLTPLTRRSFSGGKVIENLVNETAATIEVAEANQLHWINLNEASTKYVNAIGSSAADKYNLASGDRTHVNEWGGVVFARIVSDLLVGKYPEEFESVTTKNETLSALIAAAITTPPIGKANSLLAKHRRLPSLWSTTSGRTQPAPGPKQHRMSGVPVVPDLPRASVTSMANHGAAAITSPHGFNLNAGMRCDVAITALLASGATAAAVKKGFVTTKGTTFQLDGKDFYFAGSNAYYFPFFEQASNVEKGLVAAKKAGLNVFRTWGFNDRNRTTVPGGLPQYGGEGAGETPQIMQWWSNGKAEINLTPFDKVVAAAEKTGMKLIVAFTNNWADYGGMDVYTTNLGGKYHDDFYRDPKIRAAFKKYIKAFVQRYKDSSAIMAWELANEPRCGADGRGSRR
ncbi:hypothetical protein OPT61_g8383 [Boeremia exigua]|uniref:Uncharacterized protein n=1 Tax=Boeremia exigua TaxID=749465 RepID=A0ACC2I057_9PLEO|nr:hypothetical protein OPT61_g8383 [Boeremia exigua]